MKTVWIVVLGLFLTVAGPNVFAQDTAPATVTTVLKCKSQKLELKAPGDCKSVKTFQKSPPIIACYQDDPDDLRYYYCDGNGDVASSPTLPPSPQEGEVAAE